MQLCAITDRRRLLASSDSPPQGRLADGEERGLSAQLAKAAVEWSRNGVNFIQLREKDLPASVLQLLARQVIVRLDRLQSKLLINIAAPGSLEVAFAIGADGVHIPGRPQEGAVRRVRDLFRSGGRQAIVSMGCHNLGEIGIARTEEADFVLYSPVFEKQGRTQPAGQGLEALRRACEAAGRMPVFALGGITAANASECVAAGAQGVAGIRLFAEDGWRCLAHPKS